MCIRDSFREVDGEEIIWKEARFHVMVHLSLIHILDVIMCETFRLGSQKDG